MFPSTAARRQNSTSSSREDQVLSLPDGRILGYAEYGCHTGYPLMFFHGFPTSRLEAYHVDQIARRRHIRLISPDRPGFGLSTFQSRRRIMDWPADVQALAHHLSLSRFAVLGGSGGGPYALACAYALPCETLSAVGVLAGAPPWRAGTQGLPKSLRILALATEHWPTGLRGLTNGLAEAFRMILATGPVTRWIDNWLSNTQQEKDASLAIEEKRKRLLRVILEGFAQGAEGMVHEAKLLTQDWGFEFEDVAYDKVQFWHGTQDKNAPVRMIRYMVERLPHAVLHEYEGDSHWTIHHYLEDILTDLVPQTKLQDCSMKA